MGLAYIKGGCVGKYTLWLDLKQGCLTRTHRPQRVHGEKFGGL